MDEIKIKELINQLVNRAVNRKNAADSRGDYNDWFFYDGQLKVLDEVKKWIEKQ
ncbi:hypothetical protein PDJ82_00165 [Bacillus cereus group sp. TH43LC]|uniref:hypothetical protein n=1 Tax=Bacillus cereus group TaxID=86661 RepID=UPI000B324399|nr:MULTISPECIES: hypothetical protein [Bacillus cereus group]MCC2437807.1 hypothetical protein [Bacillus paranthracis]MDA1500022.1 hypothetical protein [Bacillus cereus group sp. TH43LC]MDA1862858.1 hypothetical protein [Bacillus cereus group sp. BY128LC]MDG1605844.1 hypothetical protein [Bacillus paranthracis]UTG81289.1 hypothetical protein MON10_17825 [Bacillus paranthracis]